MTETVIIIGAGPAGTTSALNLLKIGLRPIIIEKDQFPRFHIGESLTTQCVDELNSLGLDSELKQLKALRKNGVRIFSKHPQTSFYVGAGDAWQVERDKFDNMLLDKAKKRGAIVLHGKAVRIKERNRDWQVTIKQGNSDLLSRNARFVVDATGQNRFCYRQGIFPHLTEENYSRQIAFFSHCINLKKMPQDNDDTLIFHRSNHQWCWLIPLSEEKTSVGLIVPIEKFKKSTMSVDDFFLQNVKNFSPPLSLRFINASRIRAVNTISNYSYKLMPYVHHGLYCVGDSHRFIDPIFSFGVEFAIMEAKYMCKSIAHCLKLDMSDWKHHERKYMQTTSDAQDIIRDTLSYFWLYPWGFANMAHSRYKEEFLEIFAGRIYEMNVGPGLSKIRETIR